MSAEYDAETGETARPNETDEQRHAREHREGAKVGQPSDASVKEGERVKREREAAERKAAEEAEAA
jgi:hypothetical protein